MAWWEDAVTYQIYPRSLKDTTGSGVGDLRGVTESLDYIRDLGVDAVWLSPFYPSPQVDAGYDVSDYCDVDPMFGTLEDFDELVAAAHERNLKVIIDLVPNHSSDQHPLFQAALDASPGSPERDFYHFVDEPNNWRSVFGGSSWTRVADPASGRDQWYYHLFAPEQPDFNWENPQVLEFFEGVLRFWLDRGVDGFRIDVSDALIKDTAFPDSANGQPRIPKGEDSAVHDIYRRFRTVMDEYPGDRMAVLETGAPDDVVALFLREDEMHQAFNLRFVKTPWDAAAFAKAIDDSTKALGRTWVTDNHDNTRSVTRFASGQVAVGEYVPEVTGAHSLTEEELALGTKRARALALLLLSLPGSAYIYQGQELGLPEVSDLPDEVLTDPVFFRSGGKQRGRDGCRVPMPWKGEAPPFGFSGSPDTWLPQPKEWANLTPEAQESDPDSMLLWYRGLLRLRREEPALGTGQFEWVERSEELIHLRFFAPEADSLDLLVNFGEQTLPLPDGEVVAASAEIGRGLPANTSVLIRTSKS